MYLYCLCDVIQFVAFILAIIDTKSYYARGITSLPYFLATSVLDCTVVLDALLCLVECSRMNNWAVGSRPRPDTRISPPVVLSAPYHAEGPGSLGMCSNRTAPCSRPTPCSKAGRPKFPNSAKTHPAQ